MRDWPVRQKWLVLFVIMILNIIGGFILFYMTDRGVWLFVGMAFVMAAAVCVMQLRCPRCHNPVFRRRKRIGGMVWTYWGGPLPPANCGICDWNLAEPYEQVRKPA